ncbi:hypothetical protein GL4_0636 [Methyloceanibacter caenitepidi]|uniref:Uncharacterized protein n=1 Tax=Methyloceanibacter caenitepidi TaxID=1384459 RepID=A0A0A8K273_9HYPH|nr:hypothetical protein GL4_0636 [Methyloceanibacter caenitepidi]
MQTVEAALQGEKAESPTADVGNEKAEPETTDKSGEQTDEAEDDEELSDEERKLLSEKANRRFVSLTHQRDEAKRETESLKPRAEQWDRLTGFLHENDITSQEVNNALEITRLINSQDYGKALEVLGPIYEEVAARAGQVLPEDLQEDVRLGKITLDRAKELSVARANAAATQQRTERQTQRDTEKDEQERNAKVVNTAVEAVDKWAKGKAGSDPDWHLKQDAVSEQVELAINRMKREGKSFDANDPGKSAVELAENALKVVEERMKKFRPKPEERRAPNGQFASPHAKPTPKSHMEAVEQALSG